MARQPGKPSATDAGEEATGRPCAICGRPALVRYKPFCSKRCADIDLGRWLGGRYAIPATDDDEDVESPPPVDEEA